MDRQKGYGEHFLRPPATGQPPRPSAAGGVPDLRNGWRQDKARPVERRPAGRNDPAKGQGPRTGEEASAGRVGNAGNDAGRGVSGLEGNPAKIELGRFLERVIVKRRRDAL